MQRAADLSRPMLDGLMGCAERRVGSRMIAYGDVGRAIGATGSWVRKFLGGQPVRLDADTFLNIKAAYDAQCARWEAEADLQRARFLALGRGTDAMAEGASSRVGLGQSRDSEGGRPAASVVASLVGEDRQ